MENFVSQTIEPKRFNCIAYTIDFFSGVKLFHAFTFDIEQWDDSCSHLIAKPSVRAKETLKFDAFR